MRCGIAIATFVVANRAWNSKGVTGTGKIAAGATRPWSVGKRSATRVGAVFCGGASWQQGQVCVAQACGAAGIDGCESRQQCFVTAASVEGRSCLRQQQLL